MGNRLKSVVGTIILLASAATTPLYGQHQTETTSPGLKYEIISVKPSPEETQRFKAQFTPTGFSARNITPLMIMRLAFGLKNSTDDLFSGVPAWAQSERFDVEARVGEADVDKYGKLTPYERLEVLRTMLVDSFHLVAIRSVREGKVYLLLPDKGGTKIKEASPTV
ncbi:MAG: TIGR03435 family protein, partial [Terriglobus sp.]